MKQTSSTPSAACRPYLGAAFHRRRWLAVLLLGLATTAYANDPLTGTRKSAFEYASDTGLLVAETIEPGSPAFCVRTAHARDAYGNITSTTIGSCSGSVVAPRGVTVAYPAQSALVGSLTLTFPAGLLKGRSTNALGHVQTAQPEPAFGNVVSQTDANGLVTRHEYDSFGRKTLDVLPDGTQVHHRTCFLAGGGRDLSSNGSGCADSGFAPALAVSYVEVQQRDPGGSWKGATRKYFDTLGRELRQIEHPFDGGTAQADLRVVRDTFYNDTGAQVRTTQPYLSARTTEQAAASRADIGWTATEHDALGRPRTVYERDDEGADTYLGQRVAVAAFEYNGLTVTERRKRTFRNDQGVQQGTTQLVTVRINNPMGQLEQVVDAAGSTLRRQFDAFGNVVEVRDALDNSTLTTFDVRGRRIRMVDPNSGTWSYEYNALGELTRQVGPTQLAAGTSTTMGYDLLGRLVQREEPEFITRWFFDAHEDGSACARGLGQLCAVTTSNGLTRRYSFDSKGRPAGTRQSISGGPTFETALTYDARGNLQRQEYPSGIAVDYEYTARGFLARITRVALLARTMVWELRKVDAAGRPVEYVQGGVQRATRLAYDPLTGRQTAVDAGDSKSHILKQTYGWDTVGNLTHRSDRYDTSGSGKVLTETFEYDALNRLAGYQVSSPGMSPLARNVTLAYDAIGNITSKSDVGSYVYGSAATGGRPGAVLAVNGEGGNRSYAYDAAGNLVTSGGGKYTSIAYTSFNLPASMTGPAGRYEWQYGPDHERIRETKGGSRVTWYHHPDNAGGLSYEREGDTHRHYVMAMGRVVHMFESRGTVITKNEWWHTDHLGSVVAISGDLNTVKQRFSYDPFGKRRQIAGTYDASSTLEFDYPSATDRGFTGHEHLDSVGVIHMNGRTYDPHIGRFMQPDPFVQDSENLQNYNRYSYVLNNPLNATDPSGLLAWQVIAAIATVSARAVGIIDTRQMRTALGFIAMTWIAGPQNVAAFGSNAFVQSVAAAVAGGAIACGVPCGALGGMGAMFSYAVGDLAGSAYLDTREGSLLHAGAHGVVGCVTSAAGGAKCGQGAAASSFSTAFGDNPEAAGAGEALARRMLIGGTASVVAGGKFANGAISASFAYLYNLCAHGYSCGAQSSPESNQQGLTETEGDRWGIVANTAIIGSVGMAAVLPLSYATLTTYETYTLQRLTTNVVASFAENPAAMRAMLTAREAAQARGFAAANFGKAVERAVSQAVVAGPISSRLLRYTSAPFKKVPDFKSRFGPGVYDITTAGGAWSRSHLLRGYGDHLVLIQYVKP